MADSASELESDTSSIDGGPTSKLPGGSQYEQIQKRVDSLQQENRVLKIELETQKLKCKHLIEENKELRKASVTIQARAEQEEEFISNTLLKKIQELKREKEKLAMNYEQEEEYLTNDLSRKLHQLRQEKIQLETNLVREQENQVKELMRRIEKLESETMAKQATLEQLRREKVELENALEQEQEALVNRLWKKMEKLEAEKRMLQEKLEQPVSAPPSPRDHMPADGDMAGSLSQNIQALKGEVFRLRNQLNDTRQENEKNVQRLSAEEKQIREENLRLQRKLQMEIERREQLCRHLSESESSLEMDDERIYNEMTKHQDRVSRSSSAHSTSSASRPRTVSSPIPVQSSSRPLSPGLNYGSGAFSPTSPMGSLTRAAAGGQGSFLAGSSPPVFSHMPAHHAAHVPHGAGHHVPTVTKVRASNEGKFVKPHPPPPNLDKSPSSVSQSSSQSSIKSPQSPMQVDKRSQSPMQTDGKRSQSPASSPMQDPKRSPSPMHTDTSSGGSSRPSEDFHT